MRKYLITGDTHGKVLERLQQIDQTAYPVNETAVVILGDAGLNFYLNKTDERNKQRVNDFGYIVYCVRGNHEERPERIPDIQNYWDDEIRGWVRYQPQYPNIRYLLDGGVYHFNGYYTLVIGGAYSVDKWYRLSKYTPQELAEKKWTGWFEYEQLTEREMQWITESCGDRTFDIVLSHTCPLSWQPRDLFLSGLDQSTVDNSMELWLDDFKDKIRWSVWLFGHYHADRLERPGVEQYFLAIEELGTIMKRWRTYYDTGELDWYLRKSPNFYMSF